MKVAAFAALPALLLAPTVLVSSPATGGDRDSYGQYGGQYGSYGSNPYGDRYGSTSHGHGQGYQSYGHDSRYGQNGYYGGRFDYSYGGQQDVPGDYRCDAYWDRGRTDCNANWRDQRRYGYGSGYGSGYGYSHSGYGYDRGPDRNYYSSQSGRGYGRGTTYYGAYGQPDVVYAVPTGGYGGHGGGYGHSSRGGRNQGRSEWCRAAYRSYDPGSGYYRAYSGRLVYCG